MTAAEEDLIVNLIKSRGYSCMGVDISCQQCPLPKGCHGTAESVLQTAMNLLSPERLLEILLMSNPHKERSRILRTIIQTTGASCRINTLHSCGICPVSQWCAPYSNDVRYKEDLKLMAEEEILELLL